MARLYAGDAVERTSVAKQPGTAVTVDKTSTPLVAANKDRVEIVVQNDDATTNVVYLHLGPGPASANEGIRLNPGGGSWSSNSYTGPIYAAATDDGVTVLVTEI